MLRLFGFAEILTLEQAIEESLSSNPDLASIQARAKAIAEIPAQKGVLPDPILPAAIANLPTDTFSTVQEPMTQMVVGLSQKLPFPGKLALQKEAAAYEGEAAEAEVAEKRLQLVLDVKTVYADNLSRVVDWQGEGAFAADRQNSQELSGEVESVFGKAGRADTATDPAPLSMLETTIRLKPRDTWPDPTKTTKQLSIEMDAAIKFPGLANAWTMPIKTRIDMLSTRIKTPIGIKIGGPDLEVLARVANDIEQALKQLPDTLSAFADKATGGYFLDFDVNREEAARYGLTVGDVQDVIKTAVGGMNVSMTAEGQERYPINVRYPRELRDNIEQLRRVLIPTPIADAVYKGTSDRVRPIAMTATAIIVGLLPIMWGTGTGSGVIKRIAAPMVGGMFTVTLLSLLVLPIILWTGH